MILVVGLAFAIVGCSERPESEPLFVDGEIVEHDEFDISGDLDTYTGPAPLTIQFTATPINASGDVTYYWEFDDRTAGDARATYEQNPTHTFKRPGWYLIRLTAADEDGDRSTAHFLINVWRPRELELVEKFPRFRERIANRQVKRRLEYQQSWGERHGFKVPDAEPPSS